MYVILGSPDQLVSELSAAAPPGPPPLWLLCVADSEGEALPAALAACRAAGLRVCGGIFPGLIHGTVVRHTGLVAFALPAESRVTLADLGPDGVRWREAPPPVPTSGQASSLVILDCRAPGITAFLDELFDHFGNKVTHAGGGAGYHDLREAPTIFTEEGIWSCAALQILTPKTMTVRLRHGWTRVSGPYVASRTRGNIIRELNWEPAAAFYRGQVEAQDPTLTGRPVYPDLNAVYPLSIGREGSEDVIRDPTGVTPEGDLRVLSDVSENSLLYLVHGDRDSLISAARQAVEECADLPGVDCCFISDCYSRALKLGADFHLELEAASRSLAAFTTTPPEGVLAMGEIASTGNRHLEFYNKTFVIAVTHR